MLDNNSQSNESLSTSTLSSDVTNTKLNLDTTLPPKIQTDSSFDDLATFTTESTQSYSYTPVSNNSMGMRLNVLKRSLEILLENPDWLNNSLSLSAAYNNNTSNINNMIDFQPDTSKLSSLLKLEKNVSSSTLQTLLQSAVNSDTENSNSNSNVESPSSNPSDFFQEPKFLFSRSDSVSSTSTLGSCNVNLNEGIMNDLREILKLLDHIRKNDVDLSIDVEDKVLGLHNLSLTNASMANYNIRKNTLLKIKLLHALATPFIDQNSNQIISGLPVLNSTPSTLGLSTLPDTLNSSLNSGTNGCNCNSPSSPAVSSRQFHASSNAKTKSPKAVFTVSTESPWDLLNANDLGLLMFGFSRFSLRKMKLMDLIAPRSRDLVINRLNRNKALVFAGEIIAVKRENKSLAWTSLWAKRRDNLIILIFEQVVCETLDIIIERDESLQADFYVKEVLKQNKSLYGKQLINEKVSDFLPSLNSSLRNSEIGTFNNLDITSVPDSNLINKIRYFTIKRENNTFVPCAISSEFLTNDFDAKNKSDIKSLIRINLHSLPYIAGSFVVNSNDFRIQCFNEAIAKNLFGTSDLKYQSIDVIIPKFSTLVALALKENPNLNYQKGLVLPEHYFRKLNSWCQGSNDNERELLFLKCRGIEGRHNDGNIINIDIQLHVSNDNLYVIWITFCRSFLNKTHKIDRMGVDTNQEQKDNDSHKDRSLNVFKNYKVRVDDESDHHYHFNDETTDSNSLPSQLKLFDLHHQRHLDSDSQGSSSTNVSRSSSLKTINYSSVSSPSTPKIQKIKSLTKLATSPLAEHNKNDDNEEEAANENDDAHDNSNNDNKSNNEGEKKPVIEALNSNSFDLSSILTCEQHLEQEERELNYLREHSPYFPKVIGAEKRSKKFSDFTILKNLGQGAYGKVVYAQYKKDELYKDCVKAIFKERILVDTWVRDRELGTIPSEIQILYSLNKFPHANIMRIVDFFEDDNCYYLETLQHGSQTSGSVDLYDIIEVKKNMTEFEAKYIYFQTVAALTHMHSHGIVHRDIKDENIIVDKDYFVKLIDFGSAAWVKDGPFGVFVGTIDYAAPEVLNGQPYEGKSQDVWAMGVLLYTLVFKENPFCNVDEILDGEVKFPAYTDVSTECIELIKTILVTDVNKRPTMQQIKDDPWLFGFS